MIIFLCNCRGAECIGFDNIRTGFQIFLMNGRNDVWLCQRKQFIVALDEQFASLG